jgi:TolB protein
MHGGSSPLLALGLLVTLACAAAAASGASRSGPRLIVYWSTSPYPSLWAVKPDGSGRHRLVRLQKNAKRPRLSPDGQWVAFDGARPGVPAMSDFDIQVVRIDGRGRRTLTSTEEWDVDAQWSPDGKRLAFTRMPVGAKWLESRVWTVAADGADARLLTRGQWARWSPDGSRLVFDAPTDTSEGDLFAINADGTGLTQLTFTRELEQAAGWSPDGSKILLNRFGSAPGYADIYVMNVDGTGVRRLTRARDDDLAAGWSPDGKTILFTSGRGGGSHLYLMNADGSRQRKISRSLANEYDPSWG